MGFNPDQYLAEKAAPAAVPANSGGGGGFNPDAYLAAKVGTAAPAGDGSFLENAGRGVMKMVGDVGSTVDRFTGAPVRSAIGALQNGENPATAYMSQFGGDPRNAPTGKEIAQKAGLGETSMSDVAPGMYDKNAGGFMHDAGTIALSALTGRPTSKLTKGGVFDPTASGAAGAGIDIAADPLNVVGVGEIADSAKAVVKGAAEAAAKGVEYGAKAADVATGTEAATKGLDALKSAANTTGNVASAAKASISDLFKPKLAADAKNMEAIADTNGIPRELISPAHEFGDDSSITRLQRTIAEGTLGQKYLETHNAGIEATSDALDKHLTDTFGPAPATAADAGKVLQDAVDAHVSQVFDDAGMTYKSAAKQFPGIKVDDGAMAALQSKAVGMQREAKNLLRTSADATQKAQAANLNEWARIIQNSKGSYKEMSEIVQNLGKAAFSKTPVGQIPADTKKLIELYNTGSEALVQSIRNVSPAAADELVVNNSEISKMLSDKATLGKVLQADNPEQVYNGLIKNGGSEQLNTLKEVLPEDIFNQMRSKYLRDLVQYHPDEAGVKFGATMKSMGKNSDRLSYMFNPGELEGTSDLLKFGDRYGNPVMSSSGTGGSAAWRGAKDKILSAVVDEQTLDAMKARARASGSAPASPAAAAGTAGVQTSAAGAAPGASGRSLLRDRGPLESRAKAAQSVSPSTYSRPGFSGKPNVGANGPEKNDAPTKGPAKWANDGFDKMKEHVGDTDELDDLKDQAMAEPQGKKLLVAASDLNPGTKAMQKLVDRFKELYGTAST